MRTSGNKAIFVFVLLRFVYIWMLQDGSVEKRVGFSLRRIYLQLG